MCRSVGDVIMVRQLQAQLLLVFATVVLQKKTMKSMMCRVLDKQHDHYSILLERSPSDPSPLAGAGSRGLAQHDSCRLLHLVRPGILPSIHFIKTPLCPYAFETRFGWPWASPNLQLASAGCMTSHLSGTHLARWPRSWSR